MGERNLHGGHVIGHRGQAPPYLEHLLMEPVDDALEAVDIGVDAVPLAGSGADRGISLVHEGGGHL